MMIHKRGNVVLQRNIEPPSRNNCFVGNQEVLDIMIVFVPILPSVACPAVPDFHTLSHKWKDF
jgi:hypothetical protein